METLTTEFTTYVDYLVRQGGPRVSDYPEFTRWIHIWDQAWRAGVVSEAHRLAVIDSFGKAVSTDTIQGMVAQQPHGYPGDYEVIDRIYTYWTSPTPDLVRWDWYFHEQAAAKAVRNRKTYLHSLLEQLPNGARVLNLGSGPARCIYEWLTANPSTQILFDCVDNDQAAIQHARKLNCQHLNEIIFHNRNILRFRPQRRYNLIWAAGLFDYLDDNIFKFIVRRMLPALTTNGELVIGNFSVSNPTRPYMELGGWRLHHRTNDNLSALMSSCGASVKGINAEPEGVNLFVHANSY